MNYVTGVGKLQDRLIILLDLSRILQRVELQRLNEVAELASTTMTAGPSRLR
jgi:chemotaxis signal transduction protein